MTRYDPRSWFVCIRGSLYVTSYTFDACSGALAFGTGSLQKAKRFHTREAAVACAEKTFGEIVIADPET